jgi:3-isopropylmalate dehydratase/3-isopropylmalate/(R)-2-methylmalate dehydratase small subunit
MQPFAKVQGRAAPLPIANLDTDQLIPKQFLKTVERKGLAKGLFYDFRFDFDGRPKPDFVLNQPAYQGTNILVCGENFGCGSSREHAPWALLDYGIRVVIASAFGDIFYNNCFENGLLPVVLTDEQVHELMGEARGGNHMFGVDLEAQTVTSPSGKVFHFDIHPGRKEKLLKGLDSIGETLRHAGEIDTFEAAKARATPWLEVRT